LSRLIEGVAGEINEIDLANVLGEGDRLINLRDHELQRAHDWFSHEFKSRFPKLRIAEILEQICIDFDIKANHREIKSFAFRESACSKNKIILVPGTTVRSKKMKCSFWLNLYEELCRRGADCLLVGCPQQCEETSELVACGIPHVPSDDFQTAIDLISSAAGVVAVDTGLMHLAVQQGVRTVAIFGVCEVYYRPAENCLPIFTDNQRFYCSSSDYPRHDFSATFSTWDYLPPLADVGDLIDYDDYVEVANMLDLSNTRFPSELSVPVN
jgi:hypothetical protein